MLSKLFRIQYLYLFATIIWIPFSNYLSTDKAGRIPMMLSIAFMLCFFPKKSYRSIYLRFPIKILLLLFIYMIFTYMYRNVDMIPITDKIMYAYSILNCFFSFTIVYYEIVYDRSKTIFNVLIFSSIVWILFALLMNGFNLSTSSRSKIDGIDGNDFALTSVFILFCLYIKYKLQQNLPKFLTLLIVLSAIFLIVVSGSRTAFGSLSALLLCVMLDQLKNITIGKILFLIIFIIGINLFATYILNSTTIGERIMSTTTQAEDVGLETTGTILDLMGDRGGFYYYGWFEFLKNPWFGIGLLNFGPLMVNNGYVCHSEYIVQLCENGIFAFITYIIFLFILYSNIKRHKKGTIDKNILYACLFFVCFTALFFWTYNRFYILCTYAVILSLTHKNNK